jgi:cell division protein FtsI/penicillin-binding protein 2
MYSVVQCGSGSLSFERLGTSPWEIIAKTGTGEVGGAAHPQAWLLTQAPFQNPRLTIVAMKENGGEGGFVNGPMVTDMYNQIFGNIIKLAPLPPLPDPYASPTYCTDTGMVQQHP